MNRLLGAVLTLATVFGIRAYNKQAAASEIKTRLVTLCEGDSACAAAVETHFDACFDGAYTLGSRSQDAQKIARSLVTCLNQKAGEEYFVASKK
jgi:hypothetical protein